MTASSSTVLHRSSSPYSVSAPQSKKSERYVGKTLCMSAGDGVGATSTGTLVNERHLSGGDAGQQKKLESTSYSTTRYQLITLITNFIYVISKTVYLTTLTIYSWEVRSLAWWIGGLPLKILKYLLLIFLLLMTFHVVAKHGVGDAVGRLAFSSGWVQVITPRSKPEISPSFQQDQKAVSTNANWIIFLLDFALLITSGGLCYALYYDIQRAPILYVQTQTAYEAALAEMELRFAVKFAEMKESLDKMQMESEMTVKQLKDDDEQTNSRMEPLQASLIEQQKSADLLQREVSELRNAFQQASQENVPRRELNDRMAALATQHSRLNDLISAIVQEQEDKATNESRIVEIAAISFVENFLAILQNTKASDTDLTLVRAVFLSWLDDRGYVTRKELETDMNWLQGRYVTKLEQIRRDMRRRSQTITLERIVERPLVETRFAAGSETEQEVKRLIQEALSVFSADGIAQADHALESAGGFISGTRCSESYDKKTALISIFGFPFYYNINTPRSVIQPGSLPGECWSFKGSEGYLVIALSGSVCPSAFSLEHIPKELAPTGKIDSAPKDFAVLGLKDANDEDGIVLGEYQYDREGPVIQQFVKTSDSQQHFTHIELRVQSNWGNPTYTCLYRFRVHGERRDSDHPTL